MLRATNVTPARLDALYVLSTRGVMMQSKLQRVLGVARSTVSELLRDLERLKLVVRGQRFRRGRDVKITEAGSGVVDRAWSAQMHVEDAVAVAFGGPWYQRAFVYIVLLERFCRHLRRACGDGTHSRVYRWLECED